MNQHNDAKGARPVHSESLKTTRERRNERAALSVSRRIGDDIDYRAMMAREVSAERAWRIEGKVSTPALFALVDALAHESAGQYDNVRQMLERANGETL